VTGRLDKILKSTENRFIDEFRIVRPDGEIRWLAARGLVFRDSAGRPVRLSGVNYDITRRREAEERIRNMAMFPEQNPGPVLRISSGGRLLYANPAAWKVLRHWDTGPGGEVPEYVSEAAGQSISSGNTGTLEIKVDGRVISFAVAPVAGKDYVNLYGRDITATRKAERVLRQRKEEIERLAEQKTYELIETRLELERARRLSDIGLLAATVAHELRNPLSTIQIANYNIRRKIKNHKIDRNIANIDKKVEESERIINNLLFYSRLRQPRLEKIDIHSLLTEFLENVENRIDKKISVIPDIDSLRGLYIHADPVQLGEVLNNIYNNAADAVPEENGRITISAGPSDGNVMVRFRDNGGGIDPSVLKKIFDPFFTTKAKGTGLGLTVCQQIVNMHNGVINIRSTGDGETEVILMLPLQQREEEQQSATEY
jgi:signal transduction histidine kinase